MDNPVKDPAGKEKIGPKKGMLNGKNKWYVVGGLGIVAVLVFFFVSRSNSSAAPATATTDTGNANPTGAALDGTGTSGDGSLVGPAGATGATGATGAKGARGARGPKGTVPKKKKITVPPVHKPTPTKKTGSNTRFYTVKSGDTLSGIASQFNVKGGWQAIYHTNRSVIGSNPNRIHPGQRIKV